MQDDRKTKQDAPSNSDAPHRSDLAEAEKEARAQSYRARLQEYRARLGPPLEVFRVRAVSSVVRVKDHVSSGTLRRNATAFVQRAQQSGRGALRDRLLGLRFPTSDEETRQGSGLADLEQEAEEHRAKLTASVTALRSHAVVTVDEVRERASPDALRQEAAAYAERARKAGVAALTERMRRRPFGTAALAAGLALSVWHRIRAAPASLLLTGAGAAALLRSGTRDDPEADTSERTLQPMQQDGSISAPKATPQRPTPSAELPLSAAEPVPWTAIQSRRPALVRTSPPPSVNAMTRVRNDVLVRTALERPFLVGAATIAFGALIGTLSSAGTRERRRVPGRQSRAAGAATGATEADRGDSPSAADDRLKPQGRIEADPVEGQTAASKESVPQEIGAEAADPDMAKSLVSNVVNAMMDDAQNSETSASETGPLAVEVGDAAAHAVKSPAVTNPAATATALFIGGASEASDLEVALASAGVPRQSRNTGDETKAQQDSTTD